MFILSCLILSLLSCWTMLCINCALHINYWLMDFLYSVAEQTLNKQKSDFFRSSSTDGHTVINSLPTLKQNQVSERSNSIWRPLFHIKKQISFKCKLTFTPTLHSDWTVVWWCENRLGFKEIFTQLFLSLLKAFKHLWGQSVQSSSLFSSFECFTGCHTHKLPTSSSVSYSQTFH